MRLRQRRTDKMLAPESHHLASKRVASVIALLVLTWSAFAAEVIPKKPERYFNDYANVVSLPVQQELDRKLEALEKSDGSQVVVVIYPKMQSDSSIEDYTVRVAQQWGFGQKDKRNGAVLFIFVQDRKMYLQVGYGLEGPIPDATAKDITEYRIKPHFRNNDYDAGVRAGVEAIIQAAHGEYKGTGQTLKQQQRHRNQNIKGLLGLIFFAFLVIGSIRRRKGYYYRGSRRSGWVGPFWWGGGGGWGGGGSSGGGWSGGISSGGGGFGGGGAGSSW
jgi:uncharacterized protein